MRRQAKLSGILDDLMKRLGLDQAIKQRLALLVWPEVVGRTNARHSQAEAVRDGVLLVKAGSSAWAQELDLLKPQILERLNGRLGQQVIRDIHFSAGQRGWGKPPAPLQEEEEQVAPPPSSLDLAGHELARIGQMVDQVPDPELKLLLERALVALEKVGKWKAKQGWKRCASCSRTFQGRGRHCPRCRAGAGRK